jgi:hypothetical protein
MGHLGDERRQHPRGTQPIAALGTDRGGVANVCI